MSVTIKDIAERTGLAISTISKYLNGGNVLPENQKIIQKAIDELKFSINPFARSMRTNKSGIVGIIVGLPNENFTEQVLGCLQKELMTYGYACVTEKCGLSRDEQVETANFMLSKSIEALIVFNMNISIRELEIVKDKNIPIFAIGTKPDNEKCDYIFFEDCEIVEKVVSDMLKDSGSVAYLGGNIENSVQQKRYNGYVKALENAQVDINNSYISFGDCTSECGYLRMKELLSKEKRPDSVFIAHSNLLVGAYIAIIESNLRIPQDIKVASFDNEELPKSCKEELSFAISLDNDNLINAITNVLIGKIRMEQNIFYTVQISYNLMENNDKGD